MPASSIPIPQFCEWPAITNNVSTIVVLVTAKEYAKHQAQFTQKGGDLSTEGAVRWSPQRQCTPIPQFCEWPAITNNVSTIVVLVPAKEYAKHQAQFTQNGGRLGDSME